LIPKNHKHFIKPTADETGIDEMLVSDAVGFFYSELRKSLNDIQSINVKIDKLGTFRIKKKELHKLELRLKGHLNALESPETFNQMRIKKDVEEKLERVMKASGFFTEQYYRKLEHKAKKNG
jgi:hypothetical protein